MSPLERERTMQEVALLQSLSHPRIVSYRGCFLQDDHLHILMEYCPGGDLARKIRQAQVDGAPFSEAQLLSWLHDLASALAHVHNRHVLHRDVKAANVFLAADSTLRLGDFGIARVLEGTAARAKTLVGERVALL